MCSRLPASPTSCGQPRSMLRCTSSSSSDQSNWPRSISSPICARPRSMSARSCARDHALAPPACARAQGCRRCRRAQPPVETDAGGVALHQLAPSARRTAPTSPVISCRVGCLPWGLALRLPAYYRRAPRGTRGRPVATHRADQARSLRHQAARKPPGRSEGFPSPSGGRPGGPRGRHDPAHERVADQHAPG